MIDRRPGQALGRVAGQLRAVDGEDRRLEPLAARAQPGDGRRALGARQLVGRGQPDGAGDVLRPGPAMPLLGPAVLLGEEVRAVADEQRADALGALELVGAERDEVGVERRDVEVDVRRRLDRVDVEERRRAGHGPAGAISAIGWIVPTSLLASMIETRIVRSVSAASSWSGSTRP